MKATEGGIRHKGHPTHQGDSPGLMREDTEITFPLSRNVLLIGSWEPIKSDTILLTRKNIALYNGFTARHCQRFLFSTVKDFLLA